MPTDYVLFVHGVKTHERPTFEKLCNILLNRIQNSINDKSRVVKPIYFFWGDLNLAAQRELVTNIKDSPKWNDFWFRDFRTEQILEFVGDAALYLSRHVGTQVVQRFKSEAFSVLQGANTSDRLHVITHSWGTVILFDILFARRWESHDLEDETIKLVKDLRNVLFGLDPNPQTGIPLASIHTMGSPLALFSLLNISGNVNGVSTHDLTPDLRRFLQNLYNLRKKPLNWRNFSHPGDPIAYPLEGVMSMLLDGSTDYVNTQDVITDKGNIFNRPFSQRLIPLIWGGEAHGSYWDNALVGKTISEVIQAAI
ncbi:hypothetical protein NIES37_51420 [Tolypothrix tenuis PCC 7101]|uniref:AB hydrolase-1 domain-containing protein n=1 Tax=Tolypothrix tenuis PCC 7101 TaxID=231146 RepID=A0A1Z4N5X9_9CYAN|nr:hypothetical protein [Aulosira sp. FACHB-113]BAZ01143.1 hypothetical protein NIES37_51420 [Tolypothrix tenuis PCC 7101]BAZ74935.1 hypothetical protein NIES50_35140 [Aulosira laxa NIES-50]